MELGLAARRIAYRVGYRGLQLIWLLTRPHLRGVKCLITDEHLVLLVRHTYGRRSWDLPGGTIERGECPQRAARREMNEELGLDEVEWEPIGDISVQNGHHRDTLHCFRAELHSPALVVDPGELLEVRWFARAELPLDLAPHVIPIVALTAVLRADA